MKRYEYRGGLNPLQIAEIKADEATRYAAQLLTENRELKARLATFREKNRELRTRIWKLKKTRPEPQPVDLTNVTEYGGPEGLQLAAREAAEYNRRKRQEQAA